MTGRRNCARCTRWRHDVDFRWRWRKARARYNGGNRKRAATPHIDNVCNACRRKEERERYAALPDEEKRKKGARANGRAAARRAKLNEQIERTRKAIARQRQFGDDHEVDLVPFRMWLLGRARAADGGGATLARELGVDSKNLYRWLNGYYWDAENGLGWGACGEPHPIRSIRISTVDDIGVKLGESDLLDRLYPYVEKED